MSFYSKVQRGYLKLAKSKKKFYQIINSNLSIEKNQNLVLEQIKKLIK